MDKNAEKMIASAEKLPNGRKLRDNYDALRALSKSEEVKKLIAQMSPEEISGLQNANGNDAAEQLRKILASPAGRELVKKVAGITGV